MAVDVPLLLNIVDLAVLKQGAEESICAQGKVEESGTYYANRNFVAKSCQEVLFWRGM